MIKTLSQSIKREATLVSPRPVRSPRAFSPHKLVRFTTQTMIITISVLMSILHISLGHHQPLHFRHRRQPSMMSRHHHHQTIENGPLTIYECPDDYYPKEVENWMKELSLRLEEQASQNLSFSEYLTKIEEELDVGNMTASAGDHNESIEMTKFSFPNNNTWGPNDKLLGRKGSQKSAKFRLVEKEFACPPGKNSRILHWHPIFGSKMKIPACCPNSNGVHELSNMSLIVDEGSLVLNKREGERHVYKKEDFCIWRHDTKTEWVSFKVCQSTCSDISPCVRKCCPESHIVDVKSKGCIPTEQRWKPIFYRSSSESGKNTEQQVTPNVSFIVGFPECPIKYVINESPNSNFKLLLNGTLVQTDGKKRTYINAEEFCIDGTHLSERHHFDKKKGRGEYEGIINPFSEWDQLVIACIPITTQKEGVNKWRLPIFSTLNGISAFFLLVTDVVYLLLWRHQNIHGWLQFAYATSLFCTFSAFIVVQRWSYELLNISKFLCKMMGWITYLTYCTSFFFLTSMNFDLWYRFSRPLRTTRMLPKEKRREKFVGFLIFSIGIPLIFSGIGITLDYVYAGTLPHDRPPYIIPGFGEGRCYFEDKPAQLPFLYVPAGILLVIDLVFFTSTVFHLRKMHAHTELARTQSTMEDKKGVRVIAKLFVVMGVLWVFELASWIAYLLLPDKEVTLIWIFLPIDVLNSLQGVAIFFIFVWKPSVLANLKALLSTGISKTNFLQLQQSSNQSNQTNSTNMLGSNETLFTVQSDAGKD